MLKKILLTTSLIALTASAAVASDSFLTGAYAKIEAGYASTNLSSITSKNIGSKAVFGFGVGASLTDDIRGELVLSLGNDIKLGSKSDYVKFKPTTLMLSAYYDIKLDDMFTPYVGVGAGVSRIKTTVSANNVAKSSSENKLSYQLSAGTAVKLTEAATIDLGYKFTHYGAIKNISAKLKLKSHSFLVGLRYSF